MAHVDGQHSDNTFGDFEFWGAEAHAQRPRHLAFDTYRVFKEQMEPIAKSLRKL